MARLTNPVVALRHGAFRWLWIAQLASTNGQWMDNLVRGWLVYELTGSAGQLALVAAAKSLPLLAVGLLAGVLADRFDRRRLLQLAQLLTGTAHLAVAALVASGALALWHLYASAVVAGIAMAMQAPARQSLLPATVGEGELQNAVVLNAGTLTIGQALGPALGGALIAGPGFAVAFVVQAALSLASVAATARIRVPRRDSGAAPDRVLRSIVEGFRYVRGNEVVLTLLMLALVPMFLAAPHQQLVPAVAAEVLGAGPQRTGMLLGASGTGALLSLVVLAVLPPITRPGKVLLAAVTLFGLGVAVFGISNVYGLSLAALFAVGFLRSTYRTVNHTMLLAHTDELYLGRVNSIYLLDRGVMPLGTVVVGFVAEGIGSGPAVALSGAASLVACALVAARARALRSA